MLSGADHLLLRIEDKQKQAARDDTPGGVILPKEKEIEIP